MPVTISDRLVEALLLRGWREDTKQSGYRAFTQGNPKDRMFVGRAGALRRGSAPSNSRSLTDKKFYRELLGIDNLPAINLTLGGKDHD